MNLLITSAIRCRIDPRGNLWSPTGGTGYGLWRRYLEVFDEVAVMARAAQVSEAPAGWVCESGPGVRAVAIPYHIGPWEYLKALPEAARVARNAVRASDAILLRIPCHIGTLAWRFLEPGRPYGAEVLGDPRDVFAPGALRHPLRPAIRVTSTWLLRKQCASATSIAYVTRRALQQRYPPDEAGHVEACSDVVLHTSDLPSAPRRHRAGQTRWKILTIGSLEHLFKGTDVFIAAAAECHHNGLDVEATIVGDGSLRGSLESQVRESGLEGRVRFTGHLPSATVVKELEAGDLFVLPSRAEALPRALVEAMGRGLPCIGSAVGGIPELLEPEDLTPAGDAKALAAKIREVLANPARMDAMSSRNLAEARQYVNESLGARRAAVYRHLRHATEAWSKTRGAQ
jgi:glycosyltransferase involved in cell wall biosynthesis